MSSNIFYVLDSDKQWAWARIKELEQAIDALGPEFEEVFNQSTETWHDNAPFDALRDRQSLMAAERHALREVLNKAALKCPKPQAGKVGLGSVVALDDGHKTQTFFIAGHWSPKIGGHANGAVVVSYASPLGSALIGAKVGQVVAMEKPAKQLTIKNVQS